MRRCGFWPFLLARQTAVFRFRRHFFRGCSNCSDTVAGGRPPVLHYCGSFPFVVLAAPVLVQSHNSTSDMRDFFGFGASLRHCELQVGSVDVLIASLGAGGRFPSLFFCGHTVPCKLLSREHSLTTWSCALFFIVSARSAR